MERKHCERQACRQKQDSQNGRGARQGICSPSRRKQSSETGTAASHAKCATFGPLQKDDDDQGDGDDQLDCDENRLHDGPGTSFGALIDESVRRGKGFLPCRGIPRRAGFRRN
jgi:hypothetical protein